MGRAGGIGHEFLLNFTTTHTDHEYSHSIRIINTFARTTQTLSIPPHPTAVPPAKPVSTYQFWPQSVLPTWRHPVTPAVVARDTLAAAVAYATALATVDPSPCSASALFPPSPPFEISTGMPLSPQPQPPPKQYTLSLFPRLRLWVYFSLFHYL